MRCTLALAAALVALTPAPHPAAWAEDKKRDIAAIENDLVADDPAVRAKAAAELTDRFPEGAVAVPMLIDLLDDESPAVVTAAARAIDSMTVAGSSHFVRILADDENPATNALDTLYRANRDEPGPSDFLLPQAGKPRVPPEPVTFAWVALNDWTQRDPLRSRGAMLPLCEFVRHAPDEVKSLAGATLAFLAADRVEARRIVSTGDPAHARAVTAAVRLVRSSQPVRAWAGMRILERIRPTTEEGIHALLEITRLPAGNDWPAWYACEALSAAGPTAASVVPRLLEMTNEVNGMIAVRTLIRIGREQDVVRLLENKHPKSAYIAAALAREGRAAEAAVPLLLAAEPSDGCLALPALAALGSPARVALPELRARFKSDPTLDLADTILAIAPDDTDATEFVVATLDAPPENLSAALRVCWQIVGEHAGPSLSVLERIQAAVVAAARRSGKDEALDALKAIARFGDTAAFIVPDLDRLAAAEEKRRAESSAALYVSVSRERIAIALGRIGPDASVAVLRLEKWKAKGDETIRVPAAQALRRIKTKK